MNFNKIEETSDVKLLDLYKNRKLFTAEKEEIILKEVERRGGLELLTSKASSNRNSNSLKKYAIAVVVLIGITLPFHYVPSRLQVFPKENWTFSHTYISEEDIEIVISRYNEASFLAKNAMRNEPIVRKLLEQNIIQENSKKVPSEE